MKITVWQGCRIVAVLELDDRDVSVPQQEVDVDPWNLVASVRQGHASKSTTLSRPEILDD